MNARFRPRLSMPLRLALLVASLAAFMAWLALGGAATVPWEPRWFLLVHTALEVFSVVVTMLAFSTGWHGIGRQVPLRVALLAPAALAIGLFDVGHLILARGVPGMDGAAAEAGATVFSLLSRGLGVLVLLAAALAPRERMAERRTHALVLLAALGATAAGYWLALGMPSALAAVRVPGQGPTPFKTRCEIVLIAVSLAAALLLAARARATRLRTDRYLAVAAAALGLGGIGFVCHVQTDDVLGVSGHVYKLVAYLFLYGAVHVAAVQAPYLRLMRSERSLLESEHKFRSLMECAPDAILLATPDGRVAMMNARAEELFGIARAAAAGMALDVLVPGGGAEGGATECRRLHGEPFPAEVRRAATPTGQHIAIVRDVTERRSLERALLEQLTYDALTGLPNRRRILEMLDEATGAARQDGRTLAVLVFDLNAFRKINSGYGWAGGDEVLRECVARLARQLRGGDTLARQGGNEFIVVQKHSGRDAALALGESLLGCLREPFVLGSQHVFLSASVGIAMLPAAAACPSSELLQMAQLAMSGARADGPGCLRFHTAEMAHAIRARVELEALLRHAMARGQLTLQYQPRISLTDLGAGTRMVGIEALVRWRHPTLGLVPPAQFIPLAEETGLIEELDLWVLREACTQAARWRAAGLAPGRVSVNLSARQFQQAGLAQRVRTVLEDSGLQPACLELEITESTVMRDTEEAAEVLRSLKALGVALSIDDFGTGYSSLSYLKRFPLDVLKIDRSFVKDVVEDPNGAAITRAIIALAHGLNLEAVAEGVETAEQVAFLRDNGCDEIQGFYFSRPVWPEQLEEMMLKDSFNSAGELN
jgi:diguanylate cyclase (GGDEF)-like protein